jgi:putative transposase
VEFLRVAFKVSERHACRLIRLERSSNRYRHRRDDQAALRIRLKDLAAARPRFGYLRLHILLLREGWQINRKRVYRLYRMEGLELRHKKRKKRISALRVAPPVPQTPNKCWSMDFISDSLHDGRRFRALTIVDNVSRVSPAIEVGRSLTGHRVVEVLEGLAQSQGLPEVIQVDNGPEFTSKALDEWAHRRRVKLQFSRPGKPADNPFIESFNGRLRQECLDQSWFVSIEDAREKIENWRLDYNGNRPHRSLGNVSPSDFLAAWKENQQAEKLTNLLDQKTG